MNIGNGFGARHNSSGALHNPRPEVCGSIPHKEPVFYLSPPKVSLKIS